MKSLLCDIEGMEENPLSKSGELLDSIDRLEKMMADRHRTSKPTSFTKKEPFYDHEISGFSGVDEKKT